MEDLNKLLNTALKTQNQNYLSPDRMKKCFEEFEKLSKNDIQASKVFKYLFPDETSLERNDQEFWFIKYKSEINYNEYGFAIDLLNCFIQYMLNKNGLIFEMIVKEKILLFNDNKLINKFFIIIKNDKECINETIAYITKDSGFFQNNFEIDSPPENIQTNAFIKDIRLFSKIKNLTIQVNDGANKIKEFSILVNDFKTMVDLLRKDVDRLKKSNDQLINDFTQLKNGNVGLNGKVVKMEVKINNLIEQQEQLAKKMNDASQGLKKIDLRDTVKM